MKAKHLNRLLLCIKHNYNSADKKTIENYLDYDLKLDVAGAIDIVARTFNNFSYNPERLSDGNVKLDKSIGILSIPEVYTCINCDSCRSTCYARKATIQYPNVRIARFMNYLLTKYEPELFCQLISDQIVKRKKKVIRIHEAGDFYSRKYAYLWQSIILKHKRVKFYFYTKTVFQGILDKYKNVNCVNSILCDDSMNYGTPEYIDAKSKELGIDICPATVPKTSKKTKCGKNCKKCQTDQYVLFYIH